MPMINNKTSKMEGYRHIKLPKGNEDANNSVKNQPNVMTINAHV